MKTRTMKALATILAVLSTAALLCACGKTTDAAAPTPEASASASVSAEAGAPAEMPAPQDPAPAPELPADAPLSEPEAPASAPEKPASAPEKPASAPEKPASAPEKPASAPEKPDSVPEKPDSVPENPASAPETPDPAPVWAPDISFTTVDMGGKTWTDKCFADSKLTVINLWAYWCGPCVGEMPDLQKLSQEYASRGVQFLGLYNADEEKEDAAIVSKLGVTYPCLRYTSAFDAYMNTGYIPVTIFVGSDGKVLGKAYVGSRSYDQWASAIESVLE